MLENGIFTSYTDVMVMLTNNQQILIAIIGQIPKVIDSMKSFKVGGKSKMKGCIHLHVLCCNRRFAPYTSHVLQISYETGKKVDAH